MLIIGLEKISRTQFGGNCPLGYGPVFFCYIMVLAKAEQCVDAYPIHILVHVPSLLE
jgi:hypothetical protein